ncbi:MAG: hypothetical protein R2759_07275 [Bacteroidales bacterium]
MKRIILPIALIGFLFLMSCEQNKQMKIKPAPYPVAKKVDTVDVYFGHQVADPYRWLEDDNSPETEAWVNAENEVTFGYLEQIPFRNKIKERLEQIWDYPKYGVPFKEGNNFYFFKNDGMQNQYVIYKQTAWRLSRKFSSIPIHFLKTRNTTLSGLEFNHDGTLLAGISKSGSDWAEIYVMDVETKNLLDDHLRWIQILRNSHGKEMVFITAYDEPKGG